MLKANVNKRKVIRFSNVVEEVCWGCDFEWRKTGECEVFQLCKSEHGSK